MKLRLENNDGGRRRYGAQSRICNWENGTQTAKEALGEGPNSITSDNSRYWTEKGWRDTCHVNWTKSNLGLQSTPNLIVTVFILYTYVDLELDYVQEIGW